MGIGWYGIGLLVIIIGNSSLSFLGVALLWCWLYHRILCAEM